MNIATQMILLKKAQQREFALEQMKEMLDQSKQEKRAFTDAEETTFNNLEKCSGNKK